MWATEALLSSKSYLIQIQKKTIFKQPDENPTAHVFLNCASDVFLAPSSQMRIC